MLINIYEEKLQQVLNQLLQRQLIHLDDTCLQKLVDSIKEFLTKDGIKEVDLFIEFLESVNLKDHDAVDESVKTFAVRLVGVLGGHEGMFKRALEDGVVTKFYGDLWYIEAQELSVSSAAFNSLSEIIRHDCGLTWFLDRGHAGILQAAFKILGSGKSLFVVSSCQSFLTDLLNSLNKAGRGNIEVSESECEETYKHVLQRVWVIIQVKCQCSTGGDPEDQSEVSDSSFLAALEVLKNLEIYDESLVNQENLDTLMSCLPCGKNPTTKCVLDIVEKWYHHSGIEDLIEEAVVSTVETLVSNGHLETALTVSHRLFHRFPSDSRRVLEELSLTPVFRLIGHPVTSPPEYVHQVMSLMEKKRSTFTHILSSSISSMEHLTGSMLMLFLKEVCKILHGTAQQGLNVKFAVYLFHNTSIQRVVLEMISTCAEDGRLKDVICTSVLELLFEALLDLTRDSSLPVQILTLVFKGWTSVLPMFYDWMASHKEKYGTAGPDGEQVNMGRMLDDLLLLVEQKMCDVQWEVRDSALEFLGELLKKTDQPELIEWLWSHRVHINVWGCVRDQESYVRASALNTVSWLVACPPLWDSLLQHTSLEDIMQKAVEIVQTDSEAFPRRSGISLLSQIYDHASLPPETEDCILRTLQKVAISDFDWEVQLRAFTFWEKFIESCSKNTLVNTRADDQEQPYKENLNTADRLSKCGVYRVLLTAINDSDPSVCEKVCQIMLKIKLCLAGNPSSSKGVTNGRMTSDKTCQGLESCSQRDGDIGINIPQDVLNYNLVNSPDSVISTEEFMLVLHKLDLENKLATLCQSSDEYVRNPVSLLEDMLNSFSHEDDDNVIDCY